jgi:hypothetical protein
MVEAPLPASDDSPPDAYSRAGVQEGNVPVAIEGVAVEPGGRAG